MAFFGDDRVSLNNSTSTPLGSSGVFTGIGENVVDIPLLVINIFSDVASATDGLSIQFSSDNTNWDHKDFYTIPADTGKTFTIQRVASYFRIVYTNGSTAQSSFRLQVILTDTDTKSSTHRIGDDISTDDDAELVTSVLKAEDTETSNLFTNLKQTDGRLLISQEVVAPVGTTPISMSAFGDVDSTVGINTFYTITDGKTLTIQRLLGGSEENTGGSVVELFYDPDADLGINLQRISTLFVNGRSDQADLSISFDGNGTRRIVLRRRGYTASAREMFAQLQGYEETT